MDARDDAVPDRYLRADQITVSGNTGRYQRQLAQGAQHPHWYGAAGLWARRQTVPAKPFIPLVKPRPPARAPMAVRLPALMTRTIFSPTTDGRLRQVVTFTIHLRNDQKHGL